MAANWWVPAAVIIALIVVLAFAAWRRRQDGVADLNRLEETDVAGVRDPAVRAQGVRKGDDSFVVEESGEHRLPAFDEAPDRLRDTHTDIKAPDDTMSSESAVNLDQGDPLAEADFHMAYGLYDQAADLVRIALEREPDRRDLRLKLLEIYFVWGNKDAFLQTAKSLEATRDRAPAGEWDKIVIMGKQICPDDPMFASTAGSGRGAGALVDLNLEGGENRVDIDLFGDPEGEHGRADHAKDKRFGGNGRVALGCAPVPISTFTLDTPERGADESPTREMAPRDEPTVESELMNFADAPTARIAGVEVQRRIRPHILEVAEQGRPDGRGIDRRSGPGSGPSRGDGIARRQRLASGRDRSSRRRADDGRRPRREVAAHDG